MGTQLPDVQRNPPARPNAESPPKTGITMKQQFNEAKIKHFLTIDIPNSYNDATNFTCKLFRLIRTSDPTNKAKIRNEFPNEVEALERFERISLSEGWEQLPEVGSIVRTCKKVLEAEAGSPGVVYERYCLGAEEPTGVGIIFANGDYDGFSRDDLKLCGVTHTGRVDPVARYYQFDNVQTLTNDFNKGHFQQAFECV